MKRLSSSLFVAAALFVAFGASAGFREDEIFCEEAVARLAKCCPRFEAHTLECTYVNHSSDCTTQVQFPALDEATSKCIIALDCDTMVRSEVCSRAESIEPRVMASIDGGGVATTGGSTAVCP